LPSAHVIPHVGQMNSILDYNPRTQRQSAYK
jgi:hypothetical protein